MLIRHNPHPTISPFVLLSFGLHLLLLAGFSISSGVISTRYLGQPELSVQLPGVTNRLIPIPTKNKTTANLRSHDAMFIQSDATMAENIADASLPETTANDANDRHELKYTHAPDGGNRNQLLGQLQTGLSRYLVYPPLARSRGWEGTVLLGLRVESDGHLDKIRIERSSGYAVLDHSALNSLNRLGQLAEVSAWLNGRGMDMQLPVIYRLIEN